MTRTPLFDRVAGLVARADFAVAVAVLLVARAVTSDWLAAGYFAAVAFVVATCLVGGTWPAADALFDRAVRLLTTPAFSLAVAALSAAGVVVSLATRHWLFAGACVVGVWLFMLVWRVTRDEARRARARR
jgi:hypothetical protein